MSKQVTVILNGCEEIVAAGTTILDLLSLLNENDQHLIVEHNDIFIPPHQYGSLQVAAGDTVEFINPNLGG
jgi:thiamine biosynthesis protein ThiS